MSLIGLGNSDDFQSLISNDDDDLVPTDADLERLEAVKNVKKRKNAPSESPVKEREKLPKIQKTSTETPKKTLPAILPKPGGNYSFI